ncbi:SDR family oxidoreductase [Gordonia sp. HY002]|uniref:SDR family oxidoreductase n=1 Tax=Gordonia zhenghanii TaxID=2911516 RepID=UPI001EF1415B|nr:SDR family oxidoreductase [Gordonia zhenghanii]MCF8569924.1 SDR family oxidoreductase [Gordonia zhenghanii]MCF8605505.1 SDR family oxidoreductase [Gordonia zhenghanii]
MKIAVLGATGTAGRSVVRTARAAGHDVIEASRATGVDVQTGAGLAETIAGSDAVIDASNPFPADPDADVVEVFADASRRIVGACEQAGVRALVYLSICNIDADAFDDFGYYVAKRAQEKVVAASAVPHAIVRSAQWMEFALNPAAVEQFDTGVRVQDWVIQPIAVATVADVLVDTCADVRDHEIAGPEQIRLPDLTARYLRTIGDPRTVDGIAAPIPELSEGVLLAPPNAEILGPGPDEWLAGLEA